jgi:hypothetical protein
MNSSRLRALLFATTFLAAFAPAAAATPSPSPKPSASPHAPAVLPTPHMPKIPLHTEFEVMVNKKGQVVGIKSGKNSTVPMFNAWTYGNVLQMWIRHPDGTAEVGLYKVTFDYDPKTTKITRVPSLVTAGGTWGDKEGAADVMIDTAQREATEHQKNLDAQAKSLPSLHTIRGESPTPSPSPSASPPF